MSQVPLDEVIDQIKSPHLITWKKDADTHYIFSLKRRRVIWEIQLRFQANFPFSLPSAYLLDSKMIGSVAHVNFKGHICVEASDSLLWDYTRPVEVLECLLDKIVKLLDDSILKVNRVELTDEYEGYFDCIASPVNSFYEATATLEYASLKVFQTNSQKKKARPVLLNSKRKKYNDSYGNLKKDNSQVVNIIHMPLNTAVLPPKNNGKVSSSYVFDLIKKLSPNNKVRLDKLLRKEKAHTQFFVLLSMPRSEGERTQLLLNFTTDKSMVHPLLKPSFDWSVELFQLVRNNQSYLLERGGAYGNLANKKVAVVGCGSVGGEIAVMLAKAGVGELTLIDYDLFSVDNIYRHRLGGLSLNYLPDKNTGDVRQHSKVNALASMLELDFPYIKTNPKRQEFCAAIQDNDLCTSDLVIVAVGSPIVNLEINRQLKGIQVRNVIFCWNEAAGIGGHSVLLNLRESCLECLYSSEEGYSNHCQLNLLENGQKLSKNLTGCAGTFTPFSYLDSSQTAALVVKHAIDNLLLGTHSKALSWKGDNQSGLMVTDRYHKMSLKEEVELKRQNGCGLCCE